MERLGVFLERAMANELAALSALKKEPALAALKEGSEADQIGPAAKRVCLRHYDVSPAQLLNPMGASGVGELPFPRETRRRRSQNCVLRTRPVARLACPGRVMFCRKQFTSWTPMNT